ncbi:MAG: hypothetical protein MR288_02380 [Firmicutes bacterium]|nr:hypothetical protein [Bacillota bacterium]
MEKIIKNNSICKQAKHNGVFGSVELFDMINSDEIDDLIKQCYRDLGKEVYPDAILTRLIEEKGFNARPVLLDKHSYSLLITSKLTRIYRGVCYKNAVKDFVYNDKMFVGKGLYCNGIYFAYGDYSREEAESYMASRRPALFRKGWRDGAVLDAYIAQDAKVIDFYNLVRLRNKMVKKVDRYKDLSPTAKAKLIEILSDDISKSAVLCGYDAINIRHQQYMVVLNRGKLIMKKPNGKEKINER